MTRPVSLKYYGYKILTAMGKVYEYPWIAFWFTGWLVGLAKINDDRRLHALVWAAFYFIIVTVVASFWGTCARFRVPIMPFIAILSAYGWYQLKGWWLKQPVEERG